MAGGLLGGCGSGGGRGHVGLAVEGERHQLNLRCDQDGVRCPLRQRRIRRTPGPRARLFPP
ncbi:hypothetical protein A33M_1425 [Rhodovulum sp. PH10]|nr:hypothetical protein A33M_1425 [Rhodovulum sp. PH10]